jgi:hypothetical protein
MDNKRHGIRARGQYATYKGKDYLAHDIRDRVRLLTDDDPLPPGFHPCTSDWVRGEAVVPKASIERLFKVRTTCAWRGHRFEVGIIVGDIADVTYLGGKFSAVSGLPGMQRPDKYEVIGKVPVSELTDVEQSVEVRGHEADIADALRSRMRTGQGLSIPYARKWEAAGRHADRTVCCPTDDGLLVLARGIVQLGRAVFAAPSRLLIEDYPRVWWVAANRSTRGDGAPDAYLVGTEEQHTARYVGNTAEVAVEILRGMRAGTRTPPVADQLQVGFPGLADTSATYVGSWQWNVHGEASDDEFLRRAAAATLSAIEAKKQHDAGGDG